MTTTANGCIPYKVVKAWIIQSSELSFRPLTSLLCLLLNVSPTTLLSYPELYSRISKVAMSGKWVKYPAKFWRMIPFNAVVVSGLPKNLPNRYTWDAQQFPRVIPVPFNGSHWVPSKRLGMLLKALKLSLEIEKVSPAPAEKSPLHSIDMEPRKGLTGNNPVASK